MNAGFISDQKFLTLFPAQHPRAAHKHRFHPHRYYAVETAENGQIALDMISGSADGYYDAVLMDIQMPVMDGYTAVRKIRSLESKALAELPVIAMTANAFREDVDAATEAGMQAHIAKPIDADHLLKTLAEILLRK